MNSQANFVTQWLSKRAGWLLLFTILFMLPAIFPQQFSLIKKTARDWTSVASDIAKLQTATSAIEAFSNQQRREIEDGLALLKSGPSRRLDSRLLYLDSRLSTLTSACRSWKLAVATADVDSMKCHIEAAYHKSEIAFLEDLRAQLGGQRGRQELESRECGEFEALDKELREFEAANWPWYEVPFTSKNSRQIELFDKRADQQKRCEAAKTLNRVGQTIYSPAQTWEKYQLTLNRDISALLDDIRSRVGELTRSWPKRIYDEAPLAFAKALALVFTAFTVGVGIRWFFYYGVAPIAARRPPIRLINSAGGKSVSNRDVEPARQLISAVSQAISISEHEELLVHSEYLQSSADRGMKDTKWILDWQYPLSSLVSRMVLLTRIRSTSTETFVISNKVDPFSEIGLITLAVGSSLALQPHNLVGVVQLKNDPIRITRHWRLGCLSAWLTLQLRYLVFHGPAKLIVQGCRGVRIEEAGRGRSIDQAATIGFSANLEYSVTRCETFGAYLTGKHGLFNDHFEGGPGFYVYEEMPHFGKTSGVTGRGLERVTDAFLKLFGI